MGIAALVLGIIAFVLAITFVLAPLGVVLAVIGLILGIVDTVKKGKTGEKKAISLTGLILCAVMFVLLIVESFFLFIGVATYGIIAQNSSVEMGTSISEVERFNTKFSGYEGDKRGSDVKILLNNISINNSYSEHEVDVYYNGLMEEPDELKQKISAAQKYTVVLYKDIDGYVNRAYITPIYGGTTQ